MPTPAAPIIRACTSPVSTIAVVPSELAPNPETIQEIRITNGLCSSYQGTKIILRRLPALKSIVIGDSCFGKVRVFELDGLDELESVVFANLNGKNAVLRINLGGIYNVYNALAAISAVSFFDIPDKAIVEGLHKAKVKGRVEPVPVPGNYSLIIDYAHNALSMENVLSTLRLYKPNRLITMFGAGGNRPKVRRYEMGETSGRLSDLSVITEDNSRFEDVMDIIEDIKTGLAKTDGKYVVVPNRKDAIRYCMENAQDGDIIVLAGKGHEDYQEIKGVKYHMDERELVADIIKEMSEKSK